MAVNGVWRVTRLLVLVVLFVNVCPWAAGADYKAGKRAWDAGKPAEALVKWLAAADTEDRRAMLELGRLYRTGLGTPQDYVLAHMWFNLAAGQGETAALKERDALAAKMTPQQVAAAQERAREWRPLWPVGKEFRDCADCPEMVVIPAGVFMMGSPEGEEGRNKDEGPQHRVTIANRFAVGKYEVTFAEWGACAAGGGCEGYWPDDHGWGRGRRPVIYVSWKRAKAYVRWLSAKTGKGYRLLSEAEWEYVARARTTGAFHFGVTISTNLANYVGQYTYGSGSKGVYRRKTVPVGTFPANDFGLHDVHGNVAEWVEDCWHADYSRAPADGSAWTTSGDCFHRVLRGGSWLSSPSYLRSADRSWNTAGFRRDNYVGFRIARALTP